MKTKMKKSNQTICFCRHLLAATCLLILSTVCLGQVNENPDQTQPDMGDINSMIENIQNMQNSDSELKGLEPLTDDHLEGWFPESINELSRISMKRESGTMPNVTAIQATYNTIDQPEFGHADEINKLNKTFRVEVIDGAGPAGSQMIASMSMMSSMNFEKEDEREHQKLVEVNGIRAQEKFNKQTIRTELNFVYENRFMVAITATHMDPEECWKYVALLGLERLYDLTE